MKKKEIEEKAFWQGYTKGKQDTIKKIKEFVNEECEFIPDITSDKLLDRLVELIKKI